MLWGTFEMLERVSESVNRQEETRTWQAAQSAFTAAEQNLSGTVADNAYWDEAARQSYKQPVDEQWMYDSWGYATRDVNYDTAYLVTANGELIIAYHNGERWTVPPDRYLGKTLDLILGSLPTDKKTWESVSTLAMTPGGLSVVAAAPVLPVSPDVGIPAERPHVLIYVRTLTSAMLSDMGTQYIVDNLSVRSPATALDAPHVLLDHWRNPVAEVSWDRRHPGDAARANYLATALAAVIALVGAMLPLSLVHLRAMNSMEAGERAAMLSARRDHLCGLPNRLFVQEELTEKLAAAKPGELALIYLDLDGFKAVNDDYGHEIGDHLICRIAEGLAQRLEGQGVVARTGGDEFAILMTGPEAGAAAEKIAGIIYAYLKDPFDVDGRMIAIGGSMGIATLGEQPLDAGELMRRADIAMYKAKDAGRNRWRRFDAELDARHFEDVAIAAELRGFIAAGVFDVAYQPMVDARSRRIVGVEALARWPKSSPRRLPPDRFIAVAEEHGLINGLGALIFEIACREMAQLPELHLAVNVSSLQLSNPAIVEEIKRIASRYHLDLKRLEIELTESVLIKNSTRAKKVIRELQDAGITVALDDFGTGYASVGYLREYGFDKIKLDRLLTQEIAKAPGLEQVVLGTIFIARGLSATVIAEGVETEEEAMLMVEAGCQQLQGYYFGRAESVAGILNMLEATGGLRHGGERIVLA